MLHVPVASPVSLTAMSTNERPVGFPEESDTRSYTVMKKRFEPAS